MDLVGYCRGGVRARSAASFARVRRAGSGSRTCSFIPVSALHGDNVVEPSAQHALVRRAETLLELPRDGAVAADRNLNDFRFPVQYVLRPDLDYRGFAGQIASGVVRQGDEVMVLPSGQRSRVRVDRHLRGRAGGGVRAAGVTLRSTTRSTSAAATCWCSPTTCRASIAVRRDVVWMSESRSPGKQYLIKHTTSSSRRRWRRSATASTSTRCERQDGRGAAAERDRPLSLALSRPLAFDAYRQNRATGAFILIDRSPTARSAPGMIVGPHRSADTARSLGRRRRRPPTQASAVAGHRRRNARGVGQRQ